MKRRAPAPPRLLSARGGVSWITLVLLAGVVAGGYLAWVWVPVYILKFEVTQVVRDYMNQAVKDRDDAGLKDKMVKKIRALADEEEVGDDGRTRKVPAVDLRPQDVAWERDASQRPPVLHVSFEWTRQVRYPWLDRTVDATYVVDLTEDISIPDWGPAR